MIIGVKYRNTHIGFTYPSIMSAFKNHCLELIGQHNNTFRLYTQFLWGIKIYELDKLNEGFLQMKKVLAENNKKLSNESLSYLDRDELDEYIKRGANPLTFFCAIDTNYTFIDTFIDTLQVVKREGEEYISIGSMAVNRLELREEYGWDYPNKIPEQIKNWATTNN